MAMERALSVAARANKAWVAATAASVVTVKEIAEKVAAGMTAVVELRMAGTGVIATAADTVTGGKTAEKMAAASVAMAAVMTAAVDVAELVVANNWTAAAVPARTGRGMHLFAVGILIFYCPQEREARYP